MSVKNAIDNLCIVCESPNAISHFGATTCRACGAFFRRLVVSNRRYDCDCESRLRGKAENAIAKKRRILNCRGCRLRRCLGAGMKEEAVKSVSFRNFHEERKRCLEMNAKNNIQNSPPNQELLELDFTKMLLEIEEKASQIYLNVIGFSSENIKHFSSFAELLKSNDNLLAYTEQYKIRQTFHFDMDLFEENLLKYGLWQNEPAPFIKHLLISINIAKILPTYSRLELRDQVASVSGFALAAGHLIGRFHSMKKKSQTTVLEFCDYPMVKLFTKWTNSKDPVIKSLASAIFDFPMKDFLRISPGKEEFVLLLALLFTNAAIPALSKPGQHVMNEETEKCAKTLLRLQQRQFGEQGGALRYAECLQLLWNTISTARKHQELIVYIDTVYEQGRFEAVMPRILAPLVIGRQEKSVNIAKLLPAFPRLELNDQVAAVHGFVLTACNFIGRFNSMRKKLAPLVIGRKNAVEN